MDLEELLLRRLHGQHLLTAAHPLTVVQDLCGLQAQFLSHALHGLLLRSGSTDTTGMAKSWTVRGTMHLFAEQDLPLFLHRGRSHFLRPTDTLLDDGTVSASRKDYFADVILDSVANGTDRREDLKEVCIQNGMTDAEAEHLFDPWGGIIRALCEEGKLCHQVSETKAYRLCPDFEPMEEEAARLELARRYFTHFGPATVKDASYFFGTTQAKVRSWMKALPLTETEYGGKPFYYIDSALPADQGIPDCLFLAGFDQLLLGYEKKESLILPQEYLRQVFTLSGIVRPVVLVHGHAAGWWNLKNKVLTVHLFSPADHSLIRASAEQLWPDIKAIHIEVIP